jgi:hypothetical protein
MHIESTPLGLGMEKAKYTHVFHQGAALMKRRTKYVGLDVHQATTAASMREENGRLTMRGERRGCSSPPQPRPSEDVHRGLRPLLHTRHRAPEAQTIAASGSQCDGAEMAERGRTATNCP